MIRLSQFHFLSDKGFVHFLGKFLHKCMGYNSVSFLRLLIAAILITVPFFGCQENFSLKTAETTPFDTAVIAKEIQTYLTASETKTLADSTKLFLKDTLHSYYQLNQYSPFFLKSSADSAEIADILTLFRHAPEHGIDENRYAVAQLDSLFHVCQLVWRKTPVTGLAPFAALDVVLSFSAMLYINDLQLGVINPYDLDSTEYTIPLPKSNFNFFSFLQQAGKRMVMYGLQPTSPLYKTMQNELQVQRALIGSNWVKIPAIEGKIEKGKKSNIITPVVQNLKILGLIDTGYAVPKTGLYDSTVFMAVKKFQEQNGLYTDGVLGKQTIEILNLAPQKKIELLQLNLERLRHIPYRDSLDYVLVNIPEFKVFLQRDAKTVGEIKVCTGQRRERNYWERYKVYQRTKRWADKPKNFETPQVYSKIYVIVANPTWSVPNNIAKNETIHDIRKDSLFFKKKGFKVFKGGKQIDPTTVDWKTITPTNLPYSFLQDPGAGNALGKIKFLFGNRFSIYLHDTPTRPPFGQTVRAVSHGCVRVEKPLELAAFLLKDSSSYVLDDVKCEIGIKPDDPEKIDRYKALLGRKPKIKEFILKKPFPIYVVYLTARPTTDAKVMYRYDVYEKDKALHAALLKAEALKNY